MMRARPLARGSVRRLRLLATVLAVAGQLGISGASLTLASDESSVVSHTERNGVDLHHGHNEATCAACIALSIHAFVNPGAPPAWRGGIDRFALASRSLFHVAGPQLLSHSCRAPPRDT